MRFVRALVLLLTLVPAGLLAADPSPLTIHTANGKDQQFSVEFASTDAERETGLMNRAAMAADHGMLFDFGKDQPVYMWMKNTLIPLDMLFIDKNGKIVGITERAVPEDETVLASPGAVRAVLELNGGTAERLHIAIGDIVHHPMFSP